MEKLASIVRRIEPTTSSARNVGAQSIVLVRRGFCVHLAHITALSLQRFVLLAQSPSTAFCKQT